MSALRRNIPAIRVALLAVFLGLAVAFAFTQYDLARQTLRVICSSCLGLGS